ncbi:O-antigen ligase family protein [Thiocystis violacea]|uniref:O-antigen ligase family protein n=1 Tax=Thiocystis violacea TaxID=13725 RepID=UPI001F5B7C90|nr:O-antigen ligase family protein [Thiocystis violacea]
MLSDLLARIDAEPLITRLTPPLLALSAATVTTAYYQIHGPTLHSLILLSLVWLWMRSRNDRPLPIRRSTLALSGVFLVYTLIAVLSASRVGFNAEALSRLEHFSYFLAGAFLIPFLVAMRLRPIWFWGAIGATALLSGLHALWEMQTFAEVHRLATGLDYRAGGSKGKQIPFGDIATLAATLSLLGASIHLRSRRLLAGWLAVAALLGLYASLASGTRGAWVFYPTALVVIAIALIQQYPTRRRAVLLGLAGIVLVGGIALSQSPTIQARFATAIVQIQDYAPGAEVQAGNALGERFEMWRAAWMAFRSEPLLGIGVGQLNGYFKQAAEQGRISPAIADFNRGEGHTHAHNDYLHALATRGWLGLVSLLLLYLVPLAVFIRAAAIERDPEARGLGYAGILVILAYMQFSLTDSILLARMTAGYFVLLCAWLLAMNLTSRPTRTPPG